MPEVTAQRPVLIPHPLVSVPSGLTGGVVAIGNFDGVHRGHAALLEATVGAARRLNAPAVVLTFDPHPRTFFKPEAPVFRLSPLAAKARLMTAFGIDGLIVATFDAGFAGLSPGAFAESILAGRLRPAAAVVGHDFHYGKGRAGTPASLVAEGARLGFAVEVIGEINDGAGKPLSSSAIRQTLAAGAIGDADLLLGYRWFVIGEVIAGERRGRDLGFPTANIRLTADCGLRHGIYAVTVTCRGGTYGGVASFGRRPTFDNGPPLLEAFLFDFAADLYGEVLTVTFVDWIRPELRFESIDALVAAIQQDVESARAILDRAGEGTALDRRLASLAAGEVVPPARIG